MEFFLIPAFLSTPRLSNLSVLLPKSILNPPISLFSTLVQAAIISCIVYNNSFLILLACLYTICSPHSGQRDLIEVCVCVAES